MGLGGISIWQLLIILLIVVMLFGTKRLKTLGSDFGEAIKGFRNSMNNDETKAETDIKSPHNQVVNADLHKVDDSAKKG